MPEQGLNDIVFLPDVLRFGDLSEAHRGWFILVLDGVVAELGPASPEIVRPGCEIVRGGAIIPPLADAHVHLFLDGSMDKEERARVASLSGEEAVARVLFILEDYRNAGVAVVRDGGDPGGIALRAARHANKNPGRYARVAPSGEPLFRRGRYGAFLGRGVETVDEAKALMEKNREGGAVNVKILATGINSLTTPGDTGGPQFAPGELREIILAARAMGMGVMVHANGPAGAVLDLGPDSLEHGFWMSDHDLESLADGKTAWVPTMGAWATLYDHPGLDENARAVVRITDDKQIGNVKRANRMGVRIAAGSDAGTPGVTHVKGIIGEIMRLHRAGMTMREALLSSTREAFDLCGTYNEGMTLGQRAGFAIFESDPLEDLSALLRPLGVCLGGKYTPAGGDSRRKTP